MSKWSQLRAELFPHFINLKLENPVASDKTCWHDVKDNVKHSPRLSRKKSTSTKKKSLSFSWKYNAPHSFDKFSKSLRQKNKTENSSADATAGTQGHWKAAVNLASTQNIIERRYLYSFVEHSELKSNALDSQKCCQQHPCSCEYSTHSVVASNAVAAIAVDNFTDLLHQRRRRFHLKSRAFQHDVDEKIAPERR